MGKLAKGLFAGAAIGAIAALLLSPRAGKANRKKLQETAEKVHKTLAKEVAKAKELSESGYAMLVERAMSVTKDSEATKDELLAIKDQLLAHWNHLVKKTTKKKPASKT